MAKHVAGAIIFSILTVIFGAFLFISLRIVFRLKNIPVEDLAELIVFVVLGTAALAIFVILSIGSGALCLLFLILAIIKIVKAAKQPKTDTQYSTGPEPKLG